MELLDPMSPHRTDGSEHPAAIFTPGKPRAGPRIGAARVWLTDISGGEFDVAAARLVG
jgi:hypothetical protein